MAAGPLMPFSVKPDTADRVFPNFGGSGPDTEGLGVEASVGADATWKLRWLLPPALPAGTLKLQLDAVANATANDAKVNPQWASVAADGTESPDAFSLNAEGTQTLTWAAGEANEIKRLQVDLDADTAVAGEWIVMDLVFETTDWTLAAVSTWFASLIWE